MHDLHYNMWFSRVWPYSIRISDDIFEDSYIVTTDDAQVSDLKGDIAYAQVSLFSTSGTWKNSYKLKRYTCHSL